MKNGTDLAGRRPAALGQGWREHRVLLAVGVVVAAVAAGVYLAALATHPAVSMLKGFDLRVYRMGGVLARQDPGRLYTWQQQPGIQFTYTPFAALVFALITPVPFRVLMDMAAVVSTAAVLVTAGIAFRELGWRGTARTGATLLVAGIAFWLEPVQRTLYLGQVELVQMAIIVWDLCQPDRRWWKGAATGVLAGIKLVPLIFIVYLLITRRFRQAATAAAAFAATIIAGFALLPRPSAQWWLHGYFLEAGRTGFVGEMVNQSLRGTLTRLAGSVTSGQPLWLGAALATGFLGLAAAALLHRAGYTFAGLTVCGLTALLISPISWDHHWVWVVPGLAVLIDAAVRARGWTRVAWLAAAAVVVVTFGAWPRFWSAGAGLLQGGLIWYAPLTAFGTGDDPRYAEYHWHGLQLIAGNLYLAVGAAFLLIAVAAAGQALRAGPPPRASSARTAELADDGVTPPRRLPDRLRGVLGLPPGQQPGVGRPRLIALDRLHRDGLSRARVGRDGRLRDLLDLPDTGRHRRDPAERRRRDEHDHDAERGEEAELLHDPHVHGVTGRRSAHRDVMIPQRAQYRAEGEPGAGRRGQQGAEQRDVPAPGDHQQETAEEYRGAGQQLKPQPAGVVGPGLVRRVGVVEIRSYEGDECAPQAQQHQQEPAERSPAAPHLQHPSHSYHFPSE
jgi:alpha-1,2-mannosyltransferase